MTSKIRTEPLLVQCPSLPDRDILNQYIDRIYQAKWITNNGQLVQELERELTTYLDVPYLVLTANGTTALQLALKLFNVEQEVITTPFTFAATGQAINWIGAKPVFADIDSKSLCLSPQSVAEKITDKTQAILPVNVYGRTAHHEEFEELAKQHNLKLIYDGAQSFSTPSLHQKLALNSGDATILSFHATKIFNTIEGGALILNNESDYLQAKAMTNFGFSDGFPAEVGTNAKMNELEAAFGLANLHKVDLEIAKRKELTTAYLEKLGAMTELNLVSSPNYSYMPVIFDSEMTLLSVAESLAESNIFGRRYFHPLQIGSDPKLLPTASSISQRIYCLPLHNNMDIDDVTTICTLIEQAVIRNQHTALNLKRS
ncbi:DegT/DnrJ/EryC1/StrS family aminotransferase [Agarivorans sp. MS3-6]|uniref:DegT/DnrJ/EryC1/StrS family aminotransferase n=1 Tax=Agarivorans sp. TSD2052 TaxID=2937286 RepID=UPI00200D5A79|nr:DegT/DnrJ/EryC1/StrS family aminotransferase [Agarivorans sp. TSD2052]UPW20179.1 DegT/DnrJ/EryC1/StrS family aminotransferase [Agarivorans sp. TSD2052]